MLDFKWCRQSSHNLVQCGQSPCGMQKRRSVKNAQDNGRARFWLVCCYSLFQVFIVLKYILTSKQILCIIDFDHDSNHLSWWDLPFTWSNLHWVHTHALYTYATSFNFCTNMLVWKNLKRIDDLGQAQNSRRTAMWIRRFIVYLTCWFLINRT